MSTPKVPGDQELFERMWHMLTESEKVSAFSFDAFSISNAFSLSSELFLM